MTPQAFKGRSFLKAILCGCTALSLTLHPGLVLATDGIDDTGTDDVIAAPDSPTPAPYHNDFANAETAPDASAAAQSGNPGKLPVEFEAETLIHDEESQIITASGNVVLVQGDRILKADKIAYNLKENVAVAEGNVVFVDENGDTHFAEYATLTRNLREGFIQGLRSVLVDESRVWASEGTKKDKDGASVYVLREAVYTACAPCEENPEKAPPWRIKAEKVVVDQEDHTVTYRNARLEVAGIPVLYTPYYSHPDGTVKRKSGLLAPSFGYSSQLGGFAEGAYYYTFAPDFDATAGLMVTGKEGPVLKTELRKRFEDARLQFNGSVTRSERRDSVAGREITKDEEWRGHMFVDGLWEIDEKWRSGIDLRLTSDDQYLRQYEMGDDDYLQSEIYAERFSGRNYAGIKLISFQDLRVDSTNVDQPNLMPIAQADFMGEPNALLGGRWHWNSSVLNLARDGSGQDVNRLSTELGWKRRLIAPFGAVLDGSTSLRGDVYNTRDRTIASLNPAEDDSETDARLAPRVSVTASYPLARSYKTMQLRVAPEVMMVAMPDMDNDSSLPNEDSQDAQIDISNLFSEGRFPGIDRIEDRSHATYGLRTGLYGHGGEQAEVFLGQSYRFNDRDNPFSAGSGLDEQASDYVGQITAAAGDRHHLNYRFQLDGTSFQSERHELYGRTGYGPIDIGASYLYASGVPGTAYDESREEVAGGTTLDLTTNWTVNGSVVYDISGDEEERGLTRAGFGVDYKHDCYNISAYATRDLTNESSGAGGTTFMFRVGLRNLGEYTPERRGAALFGAQ